MNDLSLLTEASRFLTVAGVLLVALAAILFKKNELHKYLVLRTGQKGLIIEPPRRNRKKKKQKDGSAAIAGREEATPEDQTGAKGEEEEEALPESPSGTGDGEGKDVPEAIPEKGGKGKTSALTREGTTFLDSDVREKAEQLEKDEEWVPVSRSCRIIKDIIVNVRTAGR